MYLKLVKRTLKMSTCNRVDLDTLESRPENLIYAQKFPRTLNTRKNLYGSLLGKDSN